MDQRGMSGADAPMFLRDETLCEMDGMADIGKMQMELHARRPIQLIRT